MIDLYILYYVGNKENTYLIFSFAILVNILKHDVTVWQLKSYEILT